MKFKYFDRIKEESKKGIISTISYKFNKGGNDYLNYISDVLEEFREWKLITLIESEKGKKSFSEVLKDNWFKIKVPLLKNCLMGELEYVANHEFGEVVYIFPFRAFELLDLPKKDLNSESNIFSEVSLSDIYGDMFASTLSPISIEEQLRLVESVRKNKKFDYPSYKLKVKDYLFNFCYLKQQKLIYKSYLERLNYKNSHYQHGPELLDIMQELLTYQIGFNIKQRHDFQLKFFDSSMEAMKFTLMEFGEKKVIESINNNKNLSLIVFNYEKIKSNLESRL